MPAKKSKGKMFREFSKLNQRYTKNNHLKYLRKSVKEFCLKNDIFERELMFMLWAYDLEFWTLSYAAKDYGYSAKKIGERIVYELVRGGYVYKYFDKLTPSNTYEDHLFRDETKFNYRVRYTLTQRARLLVQRFYSNLNSS
mgnify:CR=1 FL=1|jgi:hypothetical protein|tara:strand:- start:376 stop:798 length:423 start_codon:yes stop_codon:yes gene_type:complete